MGRGLALIILLLTLACSPGGSIVVPSPAPPSPEECDSKICVTQAEYSCLAPNKQSTMKVAITRAGNVSATTYRYGTTSDGVVIPDDASTLSPNVPWREQTAYGRSSAELVITSETGKKFTRTFLRSIDCPLVPT